MTDLQKPQSFRDGQLEILIRDIADLKCTARENRTALLGKDGAPGLVANFLTLSTKVEALNQLLHNDMAHLQAKFDIMFSMKEAVQLARQDNQVTWAAVLKEWIKPVIVAIVTAALVYFIK